SSPNRVRYNLPTWSINKTTDRAKHKPIKTAVRVLGFSAPCMRLLIRLILAAKKVTIPARKSFHRLSHSYLINLSIPVHLLVKLFNGHVSGLPQILHIAHQGYLAFMKEDNLIHD